MRRGLAVTTVLIAALAPAGCSDDETDSGPAAVLADYEHARNAGDVDAVMALYAEDAVVMDHPRTGSDFVATGLSEIRGIEAHLVERQGSTGGVEFSDLVVSGSTVTFTHTFIAEGGWCSSAAGNEVTVESGRITLAVWGPAPDDSLCE